MRNAFAAIAAVFLGAADGPPTYHTVQWYAAHPQEMSEALRWCRTNAGLMPHVPTCQNADDAQAHDFDRRAREWLAQHPETDSERRLTAKVCADLKAHHVALDVLRDNRCL
jgi:hypothetical protein